MVGFEACVGERDGLLGAGNAEGSGRLAFRLHLGGVDQNEISGSTSLN